MQFDSLQALVEMGGHGAYVWPCYGLALLVVGYNLISPWWRMRQLNKEQRRQLRRQEQSL